MLTIYRASAGAGKTHKLTGESLALLFSGPNAYRRLLAVTFTNKATDEMKTRIVEELYRLASGGKSDYLAQLCAAYDLDERQARRRARKILIAILHDYSAFNISTIDRFFQQTMRAFTREIGLQGGYGIEMDQDRLLGEVIDAMLFSLDRPENKALLDWLLQFAEDKIENGGSWNLRSDILSLGRELFKESFKSASDHLRPVLDDKRLLERYRDTLYAIVRSFEAEVKRIGQKGVSIMDMFGLHYSDFKGGQNSPMKHFVKWAEGEIKEPTKTFIGLEDCLANYATKSKSSPKLAIIDAAYEEGLNACVKEAVRLFSDMSAYRSAKEIVRFYYALGILMDVSRQLADYREEKNVMLIADTTDLLSRVIDGSDAPFIYEKTGTRIDHYMIDEFQDTSAMQWHNFLPLLRDSLSRGETNLIVGDVKQSIYRFRNSDWELLHEQVRQDFTPELTREETLADNWRSCRHIVSFNNALFSIAPLLLQGLYNEALDASSLSEREKEGFRYKILGAYAHTVQNIPEPFKEKLGHVRVEFVPQDEEDDWKTIALSRLPGVIERLQERGYALSDIAILTRTNREGALVVDELLAYKESHPDSVYRYEVISDEALFVGRSAAVRFLVALLRFMRDPSDPVRERMAQLSYQVLAGSFGAPGETGFNEEIRMAIDRLATVSLYEQVEGLVRLFSAMMGDEEQVFIQAFLDMVLEFGQDEQADLGQFLDWWDETGVKQTISSPEGQDAVRIMTIHKSKGLGFKAVIIPFGDWEIDHKPMKQVILWSRPDQAPFDQLPLVPIRYGIGLSKTIFAHAYFDERLRAFVDNLNTLYVAFTRAKEELIVFSPEPKKRKDTGLVEKIGSIGDLLWNALRDDSVVVPELVHLPDYVGESAFEMGEWWRPDQRQSASAFTEIPMGRLPFVSPDGRLRLRLRGKGYFFNDAQRKHGVLMHEVLSRVRVASDVESAIKDYLRAGVVGQEEADQLVARLGALLATPGVEAWYDGSTRVLNEVDILLGKGETRRPDRVMIGDGKVTVVDYKFGEKTSSRYQRQMREYVRLIRKMGYPEVEGFLWYVALGKIERVADKA